MTTGYVEINGGKIYYEIAGAGATLVLSHAGFVDHQMWDSQWEAFAQHFRVIRFDLRGFGKSSPAEGPLCRRDDLYHLLRALDVKRAHLLGCSQSGEIMLDFALEHPAMVTALVLVSAVPSSFEMRGDPPPLLMEMIGAAQQGDTARTSELQLRIWVDGMFRQPEQVDSLVRQRAGAMNRIPVERQTWGIADAAPLNPLTPPASQRLHEVKMPTLIIVGALDHPEIARAADVMAAGIKGAQKLILPDSAHVPNMEKPTEFNQAVLNFLSALPS